MILAKKAVLFGWKTMEIPATRIASSFTMVRSAAAIASTTSTPYVSEASPPAGSFLMPRLYGFHSAWHLSSLFGTPRRLMFHKPTLPAENKRKTEYIPTKKINISQKLRKSAKFCPFPLSAHSDRRLNAEKKKDNPETIYFFTFYPTESPYFRPTAPAHVPQAGTSR